MEGAVKKLAIVVGDTTTHGGTVLTGAPTRRIMSLPMAHLGSDVVCPIHGATKIITGQRHALVDGMPLAVEGDLTSCRAFLIAGRQQVFRVETRSDVGAATSAASSGTVSEARPSAASGRAASSMPLAGLGDFSCDEHFQFMCQKKLQFSGARYVLLHDGLFMTRGVLDSQGRSTLRGTETPTGVIVALSGPSPVME